MSRLDSAIRRLMAQRDCLEAAIAALVDRDGPVLEFGLGNGRTYDHLRAALPGRDIFVFERKVAAHPDCVPPAAMLFEGDFRDTVPRAAARIGCPAVLVHADIGSGDRAATAALAAWLAPRLPPLMAPKACLVADQAMADRGLRALPLPASVPSKRYFMYQRT